MTTEQTPAEGQTGAQATEPVEGTSTPAQPEATQTAPQPPEEPVKETPPEEAAKVEEPVKDASIPEAEQPGEEKPEPDPVKLSEETEIDPELAKYFDDEDGYIHPSSRPSPAGPEDHPRTRAIREGKA